LPEVLAGIEIAQRRLASLGLASGSHDTHALLISGGGRWRRTRDMVEAQLFGEVDRAALEAAVADYGRFLQTEIRCSA
jgi:predicted metal-dependent HD superfamily phosphohydrolase